MGCELGVATEGTDIGVAHIIHKDEDEIGFGGWGGRGGAGEYGGGEDGECDQSREGVVQDSRIEGVVGHEVWSVQRVRAGRTGGYTNFREKPALGKRIRREGAEKGGGIGIFAGWRRVNWPGCLQFRLWLVSGPALSQFAGFGIEYGIHRF